MATEFYWVLAKKLRAFERAQVRMTEDEVAVELPRRAHTPIAHGIRPARGPRPSPLVEWPTTAVRATLTFIPNPLVLWVA
ncbi:MAG TPA: hypothetical protein VGQ24_02360 [Gemmatimonadales bacterium]|jgi:hypothetical protein|nr:hypothetical protein [Gemmatimonadales bacterium]